MQATDSTQKETDLLLHAQHCDNVWGSQAFQGADVCFGDVADMASLSSVAFAEPVDVVVSCLASRTGGKVIALYTAQNAVGITMHQLCLNTGTQTCHAMTC